MQKNRVSVLGQPKFDGIRCLMYKKDDHVIMESRKEQPSFILTNYEMNLFRHLEMRIILYLTVNYM